MNIYQLNRELRYKEKAGARVQLRQGISLIALTNRAAAYVQTARQNIKHLVFGGRLLLIVTLQVQSSYRVVQCSLCRSSYHSLAFSVIAEELLV